MPGRRLTQRGRPVEDLPDDLKPITPEHIHFVAIGGTGMGALAGMCKKRGITVTGSDKALYPPMSSKLEEWGIDVDEGFDEANITSRELDLVVIGNAVGEDNPEAKAVLKAAMPHMSFPDALFELALKPKHRIVVTGTHGKTTTTTMIASLLHHMKRDPSYLIGGIPVEFGDSFHDGTGDDFIVEGDEYDTAFFDKTPKFLHYHPDVLVITSVEFDHADIYRDLDHVKEAFATLVSRMPVDSIIFAATDQPGVAEVVSDAPCTVVSYGVDREGMPSEAAYRGSSVKVGPHGTGFQVTMPRSDGPHIFSVGIRVAGHFNAENAVAALAIADHLEMPMLESCAALAKFQGVKRRMEVVGVARGTIIVDDFAHHPTAVRGSVAAAKERFHGRKIFAVFEPRSNTSRRALFQDALTEAFGPADCVVIQRVDKEQPIYSATGEVTEFLNADALVQQIHGKGQEAIALSNADEIVEFLAEDARAGDVVLVMSNGSFGGIFEKLFAALGGPDPGGYRDLMLKEERALARQRQTSAEAYERRRERSRE